MKTKNVFTLLVFAFFIALSCNKEQDLKPVKKENGITSSVDTLAQVGNTTVVSTITGGSNATSDTSRVLPISTTSGSNNQGSDTSTVVINPPSTITDPNLIAHLDTLNVNNPTSTTPLECIYNGFNLNSFIPSDSNNKFVGSWRLISILDLETCVIDYAPKNINNYINTIFESDQKLNGKTYGNSYYGDFTFVNTLYKFNIVRSEAMDHPFGEKFFTVIQTVKTIKLIDSNLFLLGSKNVLIYEKDN